MIMHDCARRRFAMRPEPLNVTRLNDLYRGVTNELPQRNQLSSACAPHSPRRFEHSRAPVTISICPLTNVVVSARRHEAWICGHGVIIDLRLQDSSVQPT